MLRFDKADTLPPGPGQYKQADSCQVKNKGHEHHGYKSRTTRDLKFVTNKNPGVGDYNLKDHLATGSLPEAPKPKKQKNKNNKKSWRPTPSTCP